MASKGRSVRSLSSYQKAWPALLAAGAGWWLWQKTQNNHKQSTAPPLIDAIPEVEKRATVEGVLMRWEEYGEGKKTPVVFVHGIPTNPRLWRHVIPQVVGPQAKCFAWEMVGFGRSQESGFQRDISIAKQAEYLRQWLKHLEISRAIFVGHDLGGGVIQRLAVTHPSLVAGLVLTDSIAYDNWPVPMVRAAQSMSSAIERLPAFALKPFFNSAMHRLGHDNQQASADSTRIHWEPYSKKTGPRAFAHQLKNLNHKDTESLTPGLRRLQVPAEVIWADHDPLKLDSGRRLAEDLHAKFRVIEGGRHFTPEDHPDLIAEAIHSVLHKAKMRVS